MQTAITIWLTVSVICILLALLTPEHLIPELITHDVLEVK